MAILEPVDYAQIGFKLAEAAWCVIGSIFVSNWRMRYWNLSVFTLLVTNTFGYALISVLLIFVSFTEKPRHFVNLVFTMSGTLLNLLATTLMLLRIFIFRDSDVEGEKSYQYVSEGFLAFWMSLCAITMSFDIICNSSPSVIETDSSTEGEDENEDSIRREQSTRSRRKIDQTVKLATSLQLEGSPKNYDGVSHSSDSRSRSESNVL